MMYDFSEIVKNGISVDDGIFSHLINVATDQVDQIDGF